MGRYLRWKYGNKFYYNPVANAEYDSTYDTASTALVGQLVCKSGETTNVTCGTVDVLDGSVTYDEDGITVYSNKRVKKTDGIFCDRGDSGAIVFNAYSTNRVVGITSGKGSSGTINYGHIAKIIPALSAAGSVTLYTSSTVKTVNPNN